ncbi:MAG: aldo/keto reductase [Spirochaetaceae bacterium]|jgi:predicted aldo/keto reductase-like oxidoreductase|nr:aldo/keto reductase [Spirochaetaceae bacterium]
MEMRNLKNGKISLLGFGLMRLPCKTGFGEVDIDKGIEMVDYALAHGVNYFDTAWMYHEGNSERFAGEALSRHDRSAFFLADKMPLVSVSAEEDVERIFNEQLKKCRTDYFDFYLLHNINQAHFKTMETFAVYEKLKAKQERGLIKHLGFSFHERPELMRQVIGRYDWDFAQIQLNYVDWELQQAGTLYEMLAQKNIPVNIMEPVRGGALANLPDEAAALFKAANPAASPASWALRYAASLPGVQVVLSGMSTLEQVQDNVETMSAFTLLTDDERGVIEAVLNAYRKAATVPCTSCRYCMDCPSGVEIPKNLAVYNNYSAHAESNPMAGMIFEMEYSLFKEEERAANCVECGECKTRCPQHIDIPRWLKTISGLHEQFVKA